MTRPLRNHLPHKRRRSRFKQNFRKASLDSNTKGSINGSIINSFNRKAFIKKKKYHSENSQAGGSDSNSEDEMLNSKMVENCDNQHEGCQEVEDMAEDNGMDDNNDEELGPVNENEFFNDNVFGDENDPELVAQCDVRFGIIIEDDEDDDFDDYQLEENLNVDFEVDDDEAYGNVLIRCEDDGGGDPDEFEEAMLDRDYYAEDGDFYLEMEETGLENAAYFVDGLDLEFDDYLDDVMDEEYNLNNMAYDLENDLYDRDREMNDHYEVEYDRASDLDLSLRSLESLSLQCGLEEDPHCAYDERSSNAPGSSLESFSY